MENIVIIGAGPAGISAALYAARGNMNPLVINNGIGALERRRRSRIIMDWNSRFPVRNLRERDISGGSPGSAYPGCRVLGISGFDTFTVKTTAGDFDTVSVILATGGKRSAPKIPGLKEFEGRGVSYCAVCDAFFYRGKEVAVVGNGEFALHEAEELRNVTQDVTIYTDGKEPEFSREHPIAVNTMKIQAIEGDDKVSGLLMQSDIAAQDAEAPENSFYPADGVFVALGTAGSTEIARQMEQRSPIREISKPTKRWRQRFRDFLPQETAQADFSRFPRRLRRQYGSHQRRQICPAQKGIINKNQETLIVD